jgi:serine/threonine protein kinase
MLSPGDRIGPYTLVHKLGRGSFGVVWLAERHTAIVKMQVALKLPLHEDIDFEVVKREARLWVEASGHPNVLPIIEADVYDDQIVIVSEYAPDGSLDEWLRQHRSKAPSIDSAVEIVSGILAGLEHLHSRLIIHRDLKPANILLQGGTPRLADFGLAGVLKSSASGSLTRGTPAYMAPEAFDGRCTEQTDLWSAGVILYQLLSGRLPFPQKEIAFLIGAITRNDPDPLAGSIPKSVQEVLAHALERIPDRRCKSAADMRKALRQAQISQSEESTAELFTRPPKENQAKQHLRPKVSRKSNRGLWVLGGIAVLLLIAVATVFFLARVKSEKGALASKAATRLKRTLTGHTNSVYAVAFSPDGKTLASGSNDRTVKLWDIETSELRGTLGGHTDGVYSVAFSPDGRSLASGSNDTTVNLWDVETQELRRTLVGHTGAVYSVSFSEDGKQLFSGSNDKTVRVWDLYSGELKRTLRGLDDSVDAVATSPDGNTLASASLDNTVKLRDIRTGELKFSLTGHRRPVTSVAFSADGKTLASGSFDKTVRLWDVSDLK